MAVRKKTLKFERSKSSFHDSMCVCVCVCVCFFFLDESGPSIYSGEMKNGRYVVENGN